MSSSSLEPLPVELLHAITSFSSTSDLLSLVLSDKYLNEKLTPTIYRNVELRSLDSFLSFLNVLARSPKDMFLSRDSLAYVRILRMDFEHNINDTMVHTVSPSLERAVSRMTGVQHFLCPIKRLLLPSVCRCLFLTAAATLRSVNISPYGDDRPTRKRSADAWAEDTFVEYSPTCPQLTQLTLNLDCLCSTSTFFSYIRSLVSSHAAQLRSLSVGPGYADFTYKVLHPDDPRVWPRLERLEVDASALSWAWWSNAPAVTSLTLSGSLSLDDSGRDDNDHREEHDISSPNARRAARIKALSMYLPNLQELSCEASVLPFMLPAKTPTPRPIRKLELNWANSIHQGLDEFATHAPRWPTVLRALSFIPHSGAPVRELSFSVRELDLALLASAAPYLKTVESLLLVPVPWRSPLREDSALTQLGEGLFAHMPRLHTFVLSDGYLSRNMYACFRIHDWDMELSWLETWQVHAPVLHTVAFTHKYKWMKTERGWGSDDEKISEWLDSGGREEEERD